MKHDDHQAKTCNTCNEVKHIEEFLVHNKKTGNRRGQCRSCYSRQRAKANKNNPQWQAASNLNYAKNHPLRKLILTAKSRAKKKGIEFDIHVDDIEMVSHCPVLGMPMEMNYGGGKAAPNSPTLDRHDNSKGYVKGNVYIISHRANSLKRDATLEEVEKLLEYMRSKTT